jgi:Zn-finger nucleic acid-binding protein
MEQVQVSGVEVDRCESCQGLWFDALEDRDLRGKKNAAALDTGDAAAGAKNDVKGKIDCPRCKVRMIRMVDRKQSHVWYESCPVCYGTFFDAGEFRDVSERSLGDIFRGFRKGGRPLS